MLDKIYFRFVRPLLTRKEEQNQHSGGLWPRLVREAAAALYAGETGKIVELGCGEGLFLGKVAQANPRADVFGIDLSDDLLDQAKSKLTGYLNARLSHGDIFATDFANDYFDRCFCVNVAINLGTLANIERLITEAQRILKRGGTFIFDIRNAFSPIIQLQYRFARFYDSSLTTPVTAYNKYTIEKLLKKHGFTVQRKQYIGFGKNVFSPAILYVAEKM